MTTIARCSRPCVMSVEVRESSRRGKIYSIRYKDGSGRYIRETLGSAAAGWTKAKARKVEQQRLGAVERGYVHSERVSFPAYAERWAGETSVRRDWRWRTIKAYDRSVYRLTRHFKRFKVEDINAVHVQNFIAFASRKYAPKTVNLDLNVLHAIFDMAYVEGRVEKNPVDHAPRPKVPRKKWRILKPEEIQRVERAFTDDEQRLMFKMLTRTAMRRTELVSLRWRDIDFERGLVRVEDSKTEAGLRSIALPGLLLSELRGRMDQNPATHVFRPGKGRPGTTAWYTKGFKKALTDANITDYVRPFHDMRHTSLTNSAVLGAAPMALMAKAGHKSFNTTRQYLDLAGTVFPDEAEKLERRLSGEADSSGQ
jgi:integrase